MDVSNSAERPVHLPQELVNFGQKSTVLGMFLAFLELRRFTSQLDLTPNLIHLVLSKALHDSVDQRRQF